MKAHRTLAVFVLLGCTAPAIADTDPSARDLILLTQWFEGEFDNEEQLWFENDPRSATPEESKHVRIHTAHRRMNLPQFGEHVFYVEEYKDNDPAKVIRQRLVIFSSNDESHIIRMQQGFFKDSKALLGAHHDPNLMANLTEKDASFLDECDVYWRRVADQYHGSMIPRSCVFGEGKLRRYAVHDLILSANKYWRVDSTFLVSNDSLHVGMPVEHPFKMRRVKEYECEMTFRSESGASETMEGLHLHSQGGEVWVDNPWDNQTYGLRLRDKEYPYYDTRPDFLYFSIRQPNQVRSLGYGVYDSDSRRMGLFLGPISAHCHRQGYEFREPLELLQ